MIFCVFRFVFRDSGVGRVVFCLHCDPSVPSSRGRGWGGVGILDIFTRLDFRRFYCVFLRSGDERDEFG